MSDADEAAAHNQRHFLEHGPGLSYAYRAFVVARRPSTGEILLGGLGGLGVGRMWFAEADEHRDYPGYADAEMVE